jgi:hypothetical protein
LTVKGESTTVSIWVALAAAGAIEVGATTGAT